MFPAVGHADIRGLSSLSAGPIRQSFNSPQPCSNSLGDACSAWIARSLTLTRHRGLATVTRPPQIRFRLWSCLFIALVLRLGLLPVVEELFPSNFFLLDNSRFRLVAGLRAQKLPDKTAQLPRDRHHRLVALEASREQTRVASVQTVLRSPANGPHLLRLTLLAPA